MTTERKGETMVGSSWTRWVGACLAFLVTVATAGCSGGDAAPKPTLQSLVIGTGTGTSYAAVGIPQQLTVVGKYSDGTSAALSTGVTWTSSDETIASVDANGRISPWRAGDGVRVTATHDATGVTATTTLSCRDVVRMSGSSAVSSAVDTTATYFRVSGLQPNVLYVAEVSGMTDDVDLVVYGDMSMTTGSELCVSDKIGKYEESCVARSNAAGELWIKVDGEWTNAGAKFSFAVAAAEPVHLAATLGFPSAFPRQGSIGPVTEMYRVTGLSPNAKYEVRLSQMTADIDVQVFGDVYRFLFLCASYEAGTTDDACVARSTTDGDLFVLVSGETTTGGGDYTLSMTKQ